MNNGDLKQPPIGVIPEYLYLEKTRRMRLGDLESAIVRYINAEVEVPVEWLVEAYQLRVALAFSKNHKIEEDGKGED